MFPIFTSANLLVLCSQNNLTDGKEDLPEDTFSLLSVLLVGSLNFPFDRSRLAPRRQPSRRTFTRKLWSKLAIYLSLSISLSIYLCFPPISFFILPSLLNNSTHNSFFSSRFVSSVSLLHLFPAFAIAIRFVPLPLIDRIIYIRNIRISPSSSRYLFLSIYFHIIFDHFTCVGIKKKKMFIYDNYDVPPLVFIYVVKKKKIAR